MESGPSTALPRLRRARAMTRSKTAPNLPAQGRASGPRKLLRHVDLEVTGDPFVPFPKLAFPKLDKDAPKGEQAVQELNNIWAVAMVDADEAIVARREQKHERFLKEFRMGTQARPASGRKKASFLDREETPRLMDRRATELHLGDEETVRFSKLEKKYRTKKSKKHADDVRKVYDRENRKLRKALRQGRAAKAASGKLMRAHGMDELVGMEREEALAATRIQKLYRAYRRKLIFIEYVFKSKSAIKVQKIVRGALVRKFVRLWLARRWYLITQVQSFVRGVSDRARARRMFAYEGWAAVDIQRIWRGYAAKVRVRKRVAKRSARKIQAAWRGVKARARLDKEWVDRKVVLLQAAVQRFLAYKKFKEDWPKANAAATLIQRIFRGASARVKRNESLWERDRTHRDVYMKMLRGEEIFLAREVHLMRKERKKEGLDEKLPPLRKAWVDSIEEVRKFEHDLVGLQRERMKMSPRAIEQGWTDELDKNVEQHRVWVTDSKLKALFQVALPLRLMEDAKERSDTRWADLNERRDNLDEWWRDDRDAMWARDSEKKWATFYETRKKNIADQKRKWEFKHFTVTGKPDLSRPSGYPWKPDDFPNRQSTMFNNGMAELRIIGPDFPTKKFDRPVPEAVLGNAEFTGGGPSERRRRLSLQRRKSFDGKRNSADLRKASLRSGGGGAGGDDDGDGDGNPVSGAASAAGDDIGRSGFVMSTEGGGPEGAKPRRVPEASDSAVGHTETTSGIEKRPVMAAPGDVGAVAAAEAAARAAMAIGEVAPPPGVTLSKGMKSIQRDIAEAARVELADADAEGATVDRLATKIAAHSSNIQMVQYGALLKPLMDTMGQMQDMMNITSAALKVEDIEAKEREDKRLEAIAEGVKAEDAAELGMSEMERMQKRLKESAERQARGEEDEFVKSVAGAMDKGGDDAPEEVGPDGVVVPARLRKKPKKAKPPITPAVLKRRADNIKRTRIPWTLLDELETEKRKLAFEKAKTLPFEKKKFLGDEKIDPSLFDKEALRQQAGEGPPRKNSARELLLMLAQAKPKAKAKKSEAEGDGSGEGGGGGDGGDGDTDTADGGDGKGKSEGGASESKGDDGTGDGDGNDEVGGGGKPPTGKGATKSSGRKASTGGTSAGAGSARRDGASRRASQSSAVSKASRASQRSGGSGRSARSGSKRGGDTSEAGPAASAGAGAEGGSRRSSAHLETPGSARSRRSDHSAGSGAGSGAATRTPPPAGSPHAAASGGSTERSRRSGRSFGSGRSGGRGSGIGRADAADRAPASARSRSTLGSGSGIASDSGTDDDSDSA